MLPIEEIKILEERLLKAMQKSDLKELDELLSDDLIFTDHNGKSLRKIDDINAHKSGLFTMESIEPHEQIIKIFNEIAVVSVKLKINGTFAGNPFEGSNRFTRIWSKESGYWKVIAAHSSMIQ